MEVEGLIGRIQIVKSCAIPKIMSKASLIPVSSELIKEVNKELFSFIWKGKDKVKRSALINDIEDGGLKMLDLESMISAQRVVCVKKYCTLKIMKVPGSMFWIFISRKWVGNFCFNVTLIIEHYPLLFLSSTESVCKLGLL